MLFKLGLASALGTPAMAKRLAALFTLAVVVGGGLIVFWP
jgi:hypothetical protein